MTEVDVILDAHRRDTRRAEALIDIAVCIVALIVWAVYRSVT